MTEEVTREALEARALIGDDAAGFMNSDLGRTILGIAQQAADEAILRLKQADPDDAKAIRAIQAEIWKAESFGAWLEELVADGEAALRAIQHDEEVR